MGIQSWEEEMATHSSILAWRITWTGEPGGLQSMDCKQSGMTEQLTQKSLYRQYSQSYGSSSSQVQMWELDHREDGAQQYWCFWTVVLEKTLECSLDLEEIKLVYPKGNQPWIFIGRTDVEAQVPILWARDVKSQLIGKDPDVGEDWGQEEEGATEDEMVEQHPWLNGHEFEKTQGDGERQGRLASCSSWGHRELDTTWQLNKLHARTMTLKLTSPDQQQHRLGTCYKCMLLGPTRSAESETLGV